MRPLLIVIAVALCCGAMAQSPESVVKSFVDALNKRDYDAASKLVKGGSVPPYLKGVLDSTKEFPTLSVSNIAATVVGNLALVTYRLGALKPAGLPVLEEYLVLERSGEGWLIGVPVKTGGLAEMAYFMSNPPIFVQAHAAAQSTKCMVQLKQVAVAFFMYASDNDDVLNVTAANWQKKILPYLKGAKPFTCPEDEKGASSYSLNVNLVDKSMTDVEDPTMTVLVYEGKNGKLNFRHKGKAMVAFADGHVQAIAPETAKSLLWK